MPRLLTPADAESYVALRAEMLVDSPWSFSASPGYDKALDPVNIAKSLAGQSESGAGYAIAGVFDAPPSGRLLSTAVLIRETRPKRAHLAWIVSVYTTPSARRRGYSRQILHLLLNTARTWPNLSGILLSVSERAPNARTLYESLGFTHWGSEPDALRIDDASYTEFHMRLDLREAR